MRYLLSLFLLIGIGVNQCFRDECSYLNVGFVNDVRIRETNPVFWGNALVGNVTEVRKLGGDSSIVELCIPDTLTIPRNSVVVSGFIRAFGISGIQVIPSQTDGYIAKGEIVQGLTTDTISLNLPELDSAFVLKFIDELGRSNLKRE